MLLEIEIIAKLAGFFFHAAEAYSESFQMSSMKLLFKRLTTIHFFPVNTKYKYTIYGKNAPQENFEAS